MFFDCYRYEHNSISCVASHIYMYWVLRQKFTSDFRLVIRLHPVAAVFVIAVHHVSLACPDAVVEVVYQQCSPPTNEHA